MTGTTRLRWFKAQRAYFGLWRRPPAGSLPGEDIFHSGSHMHTVDSSHLSDELCLSSDTFSTCYAHSNGQIPPIMMEQQLVLQEECNPFAYGICSLLSQRQKKNRKILSWLHSFDLDFISTSLYLAFCNHQHIKGQIPASPIQPPFLWLSIHSHLFQPFFSPTWWCGRWLIWGVHCRWPQPCIAARGKQMARYARRSKGTRPTAGRGTPLGNKREKN